MNTKSDEIPRLPLLALAAIQGVCLYLLYRSATNDWWPANSPLWAYPLWTIVLGLPLIVLLAATRTNAASVLRLTAGFGVVLALLAVYTGWQAAPHDAFPVGNLTQTFVLTVTLALFKGLMYLQQRANGEPLTYPVLFTHSWRNFLTGLLATLFTLVFWLILTLCAQLFRVIQIDLFHELFSEEWFIIPVLTTAFALGVILFRGLTHIIDSITKLLHWLIKLLLPLVLIVAVGFIAALPFAGLNLLWETGRGTSLMLWLLATVLFFVNAVYQDGRESSPYPPLVHRAIYLAMFVMPIIAALALYGLMLRIAQYGWTVERCWGIVVWAVLTLFAIGYVVGIVRRRDAWTGELARVNIGMGLVVLAVMLLGNSPLLDFRKISLSSQQNRVESGEIEIEEFDFWYAKNSLARPGFLWMQELKESAAGTNPRLVALIEEPSPPWRNRPTIASDEFWQRVVYLPETVVVPDDLKPIIERDGQNAINRRDADSFDPFVIRADIDGDGMDEYVMLVIGTDYIAASRFYWQDAAGWQSQYLQFHAEGAMASAREALESGTLRLTEKRYRIIEVGDVRLVPQEPQSPPRARAGRIPSPTAPVEPLPP